MFVAIAILVGGAVLTNSKGDSGDIKIGAILNLTGAFADMGENSQHAIDLAVSEINSSGGVMGRKLVIDYQDNNGDNPKGALTALYNLTDRNIRLIIGPDLTPSGNVLAPLVEKVNALLISPAIGDGKFNEVSPQAFSIYPIDKFSSFALAEHLYKDKGYRKIAIFGSKQEWENLQAQFVKQRFEELGGTVTSMQIPMVDNKDLRAESLKIKNSNPEAVVFTNYGETGLAAKRLRDIGVTQSFFSIILSTPQIAIAQGSMEGLVFNSTDAVNTDFGKKFKNKYQKDPSFPASQAYDAVYMLAKGIEQSNSTNPKQVASVLRSIKEWNGASGSITFDAEGNAHKPILYYEVKNGEVVPLEK